MIHVIRLSHGFASSLVYRFQLLVTSIFLDNADAKYKYELKLFDTLDPKNPALVQTALVEVGNAPPDPLLAAAVTVSRDDQHIFVYHPETAVRGDIERQMAVEHCIPPFAVARAD